MTTPNTTPAASESRHTPWPWYLHTLKSGILLETGIAARHARGNHEWIGSLNGGVNRNDDMERIVTCVNACEGMADPADELARLRASNEELHTLLETALANGEHVLENRHFRSFDEDIVRADIATIRNAAKAIASNAGGAL